MPNPMTDLSERYLPSQQQMTVAAAMLAAAPAAAYVVVPLALPGKTHGMWQLGQPVEHPLAFILATEDGRREATYRADAIAKDALGTRDGCTAYAVIEREPGAAARVGAAVWDGFECNH